MEGWQLALVVIAAVFVGMWIPVSLQLFGLLRAGKHTLGEVSTAVVTVNQTIAEAGEIVHAAAQIKDSIRVMSSIGAAVVPTVIALVRGLREPKAETEDPAGSNGASAATPEQSPRGDA